jgi:hypothetical protein
MCNFTICSLLCQAKIGLFASRNDPLRIHFAHVVETRVAPPPSAVDFLRTSFSHAAKPLKKPIPCCRRPGAPNEPGFGLSVGW